jgi:ABC-type antimicrobial peptide transport system permease subunit
MQLLKTSLKNMKKNKLMNIITLLEFTATIIIAVIMISSVLIRYKYYTPFKDMFQSNGLLCEFLGMADENFRNPDMDSNYICNDEISDVLHSPTGIAACNKVMGIAVADDGETYLNTNNYAYNDEIIKRFTPTLKEGRWLNTSDNANTIEAVISENDYGWKLGDKIHFVFSKDSQTPVLDVEIVGILKNNSKVPGGFAVHGENDNFNMFFNTYNFEIEEIPLILFSSEYIADSGIDEALFSYSIITYPDSVTEEELNADRETLYNYGCQYSISLSDMDRNSKQYLYRQVYNLLPIIIVILVLAFVSSISSTALSTRQRLRDYSIYYICGLQWKQCIFVNLIQSVVIAVFSTVLSFAGLYFLRFTPIADSITVIWNIWTFAAVLGLVLIYMLISMIMPIIIIGKNTPKEILTR